MFGSLSQRIRNARKDRINKRHFPTFKSFIQGRIEFLRSREQA